MQNTLTGEVHLIMEVEQITEKFRKRTIVIETDKSSQYPQLIPISLQNDKTSLSDGLNVGDQVEVSFNLRGREYNGKYYPEITGWKIEVKQKAAAPEPSYEPVRYTEPPPTGVIPLDDLPF